MYILGIEFDMVTEFVFVTSFNFYVCMMVRHLKNF